MRHALSVRVSSRA